MPFNPKYPAQNCELYEYESRFARCAKQGDWIEFQFAKPVKCNYLKVATGYEHLRRCLIYKGHLEVCYDGKKFVRAGNLSDGAFILRPKKKSVVHALRIVADGISDAEDRCIVQPLIIK